MMINKLVRTGAIPVAGALLAVVAIAFAVFATATTVSASEACTPGFWKNHQDAWYDFAPGDTLTDAGFVLGALTTDLNGVGGEDTLLDALRYHGGRGNEGGARILLRAGVAALLNADHPAVIFFGEGLAEADVLDMVNAALAGDRSDMIAAATTLDGYNNTPPCPVGGDD